MIYSRLKNNSLYKLITKPHMEPKYSSSELNLFIVNPNVPTLSIRNDYKIYRLGLADLLSFDV